MRQFQINYNKRAALAVWLKQVRDYCDEHNIPGRNVIFRIYSDTTDADAVNEILPEIKKGFSEAFYAGITTNGNIVYGSLSDSCISITCMVFDDPGTCIRTLQYPMTEKTQADTIARVIKEAERFPGLKSIEILTTLGSADIPSLCSELSALPENIMVYGGGAHAANLVDGDTKDTYVFSDSGSLSPHSAVFILLGGPNLNIYTGCMNGWKKMGRKFMITKSSNNILSELDHKPALEVYRHYLNTPDDDRFYKLSVVFPFLFENGEESYLRVIALRMEDGSLRMASYINDAVSCYLAFGDPINIMEEMSAEFEKICGFMPQAIQLFSCAGRKLFWGPTEINRETMPFESAASTSGFFTSGELIRINGRIALHNLALVVVAMREGEADQNAEKIDFPEMLIRTRQLMICHSLASFIQTREREMESDIGRTV